MPDQNLKDLAYRTTASVFGGPVDLATMVMRPFGYKTTDQQVVGGSEWIGKKLEDVGLISSARSPITEFLTSMAVPTPGGIAKGAAMAAPMVGGMFVGKGSKTWDALAADKAKIMADMGTDARTIWKETGTWKGPDGKWRQEISDKPAEITDDVYAGIKEKQRFEGPMQQALSHPQLYEAYPDTGKIQSGMYAWRTPEGSYHSATDTITVGGPGTTSQKSASLHELQHAIQGREGFAQGGSPNDPALMPYVRKFYVNNIDQFQGEGHELLNMAKQRAYQNLAGEAEARATQARMNMTPEQRRATFPEESYDVPLNQLIIQGLK